MKGSRRARASAAEFWEKCAEIHFGSVTITMMIAASRWAVPSPFGSATGRTNSDFFVARRNPFPRREAWSERSAQTSIGYSDDGLPDEFYVAIGFLDNPERFKPQAHAYWKMKLPWLVIADDLPKAENYMWRRDPAFGYPASRRPD